MGKRFFSFPKVKASSGAHPASCSVGTGGYSLGVKQPVLEAGH